MYLGASFCRSSSGSFLALLAGRTSSDSLCSPTCASRLASGRSLCRKGSLKPLPLIDMMLAVAAGVAGRARAWVAVVFRANALDFRTLCGPGRVSNMD